MQEMFQGTIIARRILSIETLKEEFQPIFSKTLIVEKMKNLRFWQIWPTNFNLPGTKNKKLGGEKLLNLVFSIEVSIKKAAGKLARTHVRIS